MNFPSAITDSDVTHVGVAESTLALNTLILCCAREAGSIPAYEGRSRTLDLTAGAIPVEGGQIL